MPRMSVRMMFGKPGVMKSQLISKTSLLDNFVIDFPRRLVARSLDVVGQADTEHDGVEGPPERQSSVVPISSRFTDRFSI